jgi:hypothetical protein
VAVGRRWCSSEGWRIRPCLKSKGDGKKVRCEIRIVDICGESEDLRFIILLSYFVILLLPTPRIPNSVANPDVYMFRCGKKFQGWPLSNEKFHGWQLDVEGRERAHGTFAGLGEGRSMLSWERNRSTGSPSDR